MGILEPEFLYLHGVYRLGEFGKFGKSQEFEKKIRKSGNSPIFSRSLEKTKK